MKKDKHQENYRLYRNAHRCILLLNCSLLHWLQLIDVSVSHQIWSVWTHSLLTVYYPCFEGSYCYRYTKELIWTPNQSLCGCSYIVSCHRRCHYTLCVVEGFIQKLDKLYANTYISFSMLYDEMYIDLQHILLVITELDLAKMCFLKCLVFFIWILFALLGWFWMLQRCLFLPFKCFLFQNHLTSFAFCLTTISVSVHLFNCHDS